LLDDWRVDWLQQTLSKLEANLPALAEARTFPPDLSLPSARHPLATASLQPKPYTILLVDRSEANAFSFGWPLDADMPPGLQKQGVICVYTGMLDALLGRDSREAGEVGEEAGRQLAVVLAHETAHLARLVLTFLRTLIIMANRS
jgi:Zn-dependent protease with chaperone function